MSRDELVRYVELELQWLRYYADSDSRKSFDPNKPPYEQLVSIGYAKKVFPLRYRCGFNLVTSDQKISDSSDVSGLHLSSDVSAPYTYTPLEAFLILYPAERLWVYEQLNS